MMAALKAVMMVVKTVDMMVEMMAVM